MPKTTNWDRIEKKRCKKFWTKIPAFRESKLFSTGKGLWQVNTA